MLTEVLWAFPSVVPAAGFPGSTLGVALAVDGLLVSGLEEVVAAILAGSDFGFEGVDGVGVLLATADGSEDGTREFGDPFGPS